MQESESSEGENEDKTTPKPLAKKVAENAATQKAQVQLKKPDPSKKVILNIQVITTQYSHIFNIHFIYSGPRARISREKIAMDAARISPK